MSHDDVFRQPRDQIVDFVFDERVASVFPDMIRRSVPGYETVVPLTGLIGARHAQNGTRCYDLGCSLGASSIALERQLDRVGIEDCPIIAVDDSPAMLAEARRLLPSARRIRWHLGDIVKLDYELASVIVMNYTLQFLSPSARLPLLERLRHALVPGGVLLVAEKICFDDPTAQQYFSEVHHAFKRANGYSDLEVSQKRQAIENVLIPDTIATHEARFVAAGFSRVDTWFQCLNWAAFAAHA
jgi:tRNA (cmo5U34)-methyltransferase